MSIGFEWQCVCNKQRNANVLYSTICARQRYSRFAHAPDTRSCSHIGAKNMKSGARLIFIAHLYRSFLKSVRPDVNHQSIYTYTQTKLADVAKVPRASRLLMRARACACVYRSTCIIFLCAIDRQISTRQRLKIVKILQRRRRHFSTTRTLGYSSVFTRDFSEIMRIKSIIKFARGANQSLDDERS